MKYAISAAALMAGLALAGCGFGGPKYPSFGESAYRIEGSTTPESGGAPIQTVIYRDGPRMRIETTLPNRGASTIVFDEATNAAYVLQPVAAPAAPAMTTTATTPAPAAQPGAPASTTTTTTAPPAPSQAAPAAAPATSAGVAVRIADQDAPEAIETAWAALGAENARHVGACNVAGESGERWQPKGDTGGVERTACITEDGIVLEVVEGDRTLFQATRLTRGQQDRTLFGVPAGYQIVDPAAVVESVDQTVGQLNSVTGAAPAQTPQTTPTPPPPG